MIKRLLKIAAWFFGVIMLLVIIAIIYVRAVSVTDPPVVPAVAIESFKISEPDSGLFKIGRNWFRQSESGLFELYVEGSPYERGIVNGELTKQLVRYQEEASVSNVLATAKATQGRLGNALQPLLHA